VTKAVPFTTKARTIDHLGREQIADGPTAVSELWKNAYDAYATSVALRIYDGSPSVATIMDNGHGMSEQEFRDRWLVVGTESKFEGDHTPKKDRKGLKIRTKQGQKGIGRLSVAALGSIVLVLSKREKEPFVAALIDWRLFENPFLMLQDIQLPVFTFDNPEELFQELPTMFDILVDNVWGSEEDIDRQKRLVAAWEALDRIERKDVLKTNKSFRTTSEQISDTAIETAFTDRHLEKWGVWHGEETSGTCLLIADLTFALSCWVEPLHEGNQDEAASMQDSMHRTLTGFADPYTEIAEKFDYQVSTHRGERERTVIAHNDHLGLGFIRSLEHSVIGSFDQHGVFTGTVKAFDRDFGEINISPTIQISTGQRSKIGPFSLCIGAYEPSLNKSTHPEAIHQKIEDLAENHSGLAMYRDGLRVMPYGRPEHDFFKIEERRQFHAGREFWASRKLFGRISITRGENPNLKDKAGREGLIDNKASREMQLLVIEVLMKLARRYFGTDASVRKELLPEIVEKNEEAAKKAKGARGFKAKEFRTKLKENSPQLDEVLEQVGRIELQLAEAIKKNDGDTVGMLDDEVQSLSGIKADLRLPPRPKKLNKLEDAYRNYRDRYIALGSAVERITQGWREASEKLAVRPPAEIAKTYLGRHQKFLTDQISKWEREIGGLLTSERTRIENQAAVDRGRYYQTVSPLLTELENDQIKLAIALEEMGVVRERQYLQYEEFYVPYIRALKQLSQGIDLDGAFSYAGDREAELSNKVDELNGLAQLGIAVEIVGHELHDQYNIVKGELKKLPKSVQDNASFKRMTAAQEALVERLRFLTQMKLSGNDLKETITGEMIVEHLENFFGPRIANLGVSFETTKSFRAIELQDFRSRIFPVFINLLNNALYWVSTSDERKVKIDMVGDTVVIGDTGPGVDPDDIEYLFTLFFTRRVRGHGVGLYLCRETLAAGGHEISYAEDNDYKLLSGANFAIKFRGLGDG